MLYILTSFYIVTLGLLSRNIKQNKVMKMIFTVLFFLPLIILCSFKETNVGNDTLTYYNFYVNLKGTSFTLNSKFEEGFHLLAWTFSNIGFGFNLFLLICYIIIYLPYILFSYKYSKHPSLAALACLFFGLFAFNMSGLRQALSISISLIGIYILMRNKRTIGITCSCLFILIAFFFHKSSICMIPVIPLFVYRNKVNLNIWYLVPTFFLLSFLSPYLYTLIFDFVQDSFYYDAPKSVFFLDIGFSTYILIVVLLFVLIFRNSPFFTKIDHYFCKYECDIFENTFARNEKETIDNNNDLFFISCLVLNILVSCLLTSSQVMIRLTYFYTFFSCLVISNSLNTIKSKKLFIFGFLAIWLMLVIYFYFAIIKNNYLGLCPFVSGKHWWLYD